MAQIAAISSPALADGFRLTGITVLTPMPGAQMQSALRTLLDDPEVGLLLVTEDLWASLDERTRGTIEYLPRPLVLSVPAGAVTEAGARRELLGEMLERAIGYRIELGGTPS
jgi:vacuolar-type H+-ATPase subunit F/Vma7